MQYGVVEHSSSVQYGIVQHSSSTVVMQLDYAVVIYSFFTCKSFVSHKELEVIWGERTENLLDWGAGRVRARRGRVRRR